MRHPDEASTAASAANRHDRFAVPSAPAGRTGGLIWDAVRTGRSAIGRIPHGMRASGHRPWRRDHRIRSARPGARPQGPQTASTAPICSASMPPPKPSTLQACVAYRDALGAGRRGAFQRPHRRLRRLRPAAATRASTSFSPPHNGERRSRDLRPRAGQHGESACGSCGLPNNVLCHIGIRHGFKGPNACIDQPLRRAASMAIAEAAAALRAGEADRALPSGHDAPVEPQMVLYYQQLGLLARTPFVPFDAGRSGSLLGEGAAALMLETGRAARRAQRHGPRRISRQRLRQRRGGSAGHPRRRRRARRRASVGARRCARSPGRVGMIVAHGNGTRSPMPPKPQPFARCSVRAARRSPLSSGPLAISWRLPASSISSWRCSPALRRGPRHPDAARAGSRGREPAGVRAAQRPAVTWRWSSTAASAGPTPRSSSEPQPATPRDGGHRQAPHSLRHRHRRDRTRRALAPARHPPKTCSSSSPERELQRRRRRTRPGGQASPPGWRPRKPASSCSRARQRGG